MQVSMESVLRRGANWKEHPGLRGAACFGGGLVLSALEIGGGMQPAAVGLIAATRGWSCCAAAAGSGLGYLLFWGGHGLTALIWVLGAFLLTLLKREKIWLVGGCMVLAAVTGILWKENVPILVSVAGLSAAVGCWENRSREHLALGAGVMAVACRSPCIGILLGGFGATALNMPGALALTVGADLGSKWYLLTVAASIGYYYRKICKNSRYSRELSLPLSLLTVMLLGGNRQWQFSALAALGGFLGAMVPLPVPKRGRVGRAQVQLEETAQVMTGLQRQLLDWVSPPPDVAGLTQELRQNLCDACPNRADCVERAALDERIFTSQAPFLCRKAAAEETVERFRQLLRRMQAIRAKEEEYRMALVQQYGFLADAVRELSDRLSQRAGKRARYRVLVSARSRSRETADGDRVAAFPGVGGKYYVLLCDGMGTGRDAAAESREMVGLITRMLQSGLSPGAVLGSVNSQLALTDRGGAVTVDLCELHPDCGRVWLYKWGAQPSILLRRKRSVTVGTSGPPPGLGVTEGRESVSRVHLQQGDTLLLLSDGVSQNHAAQWAKFSAATPPGALAGIILKSDAATPDDATAVVIRMERKRVDYEHVG